MPGIGALETTRRVRLVSSECAVVGIGDHRSGPIPLRLLEVGAAAYLSKRSQRAELERAVRAVAAGECYVAGALARELVLSRYGGAVSELDTLTRRELEVMLQVSKAHTLKEIGEALSLSPKTVSTYRTRVCRKLGVNTDVELTHAALRNGLLSPAAL